MYKFTLRTLLLTTCVAASQVNGQDGFAISRDGETVAGDSRITDQTRPVVPAFSSDADVQVTADGLGVRPRLALEVVDVAPGRTALRSRTNYPAWIARAELHIVDINGSDGEAAATVVPIPVNGEIGVSLSDPDGYAAFLRVYDGAGRYNETIAVGLGRAHGTDEEIGDDMTRRRGIPVPGGAVTVSGRDLAPGAVVSAFGETVKPDADGSFVIQRIYPVGEAVIPVRVTGGGEDIALDPVVSIPRSEWFSVGTADITFGKTLSGPDKGYSWNRGRLAYYTSGKLANGWAITSSADTGEAPIEDLFRDFDRRDPLGLIRRLDPDLAYPTYGDDSGLENDAPTDGKFYLKVQRDGSYLMWGNAQAPIRSEGYIRNERALYGLSGQYQSPALTERGDPHLTFGAYAASPDRLPGREIFLGTGGSVYFLQRQDIGIGTETLSIEVRDPDTGSIISTRTLEEGRDYRINYVQGVIVLTSPLSGQTGDDGVITPAPGTASQTRLVVHYEYTPAASDIDGMAYGGRLEAWVTEDVRVGVTGMVERTDTADQKASGVDLLWKIGEESEVSLDHAASSGPGFGTSTSPDGGLTIITDPTVSGTGQAARVSAKLAFGDIGLAGEGTLSLWAERRGKGFSTLDYQVEADENTAGIEVNAKPSERLSYRVRAETYRNDDGKSVDEALAEVTWAQSERLSWSVGLKHEDRNDPVSIADTGRRTDFALKATVTPSDAFSWYVFGQSTLARSGGLERNDRLGAGASLKFAESWRVEGEVSGGTSGPAGRVLVAYERAGISAYLGYELEPGRELDGVTLNGGDDGKFIAGGRRQVNDAFAVYGENTYDLFGQRRTLTSTYGVDYKMSSTLTFTGNLEVGRVDDPLGDFDRRGVSVGAQYDDGDGRTARARVELIQDRGLRSGTPSDSDTIALTAAASYKIDDARRLLFSLDAASTTANATLPEGDYARLTFGYAFRPVQNDRLNFHARYTYLYDLYGQRVDGSDDPGARQRSHVLSLDATWEANARWTLGTKVGLRISESSADDTSPFVSNDAGLLVLNARYHLTHQWDVLLEGRYLDLVDARTTEKSLLATVYRHVGPNAMVGLGYSFGNVSDDLTDLSTDNSGVFLNIVTSF